MKHTPGPWRAEKYCIWAGDKYIAGTQTGIGEPQEANARLIAAAPDLLYQLKRAHARIKNSVPPIWGPTSEKGYLLSEIEAAIAKAEGRELP